MSRSLLSEASLSCSHIRGPFCKLSRDDFEGISTQNSLAESMHYERAALLRGAYRVDVRQESEEKIGKSAEE